MTHSIDPEFAARLAEYQKKAKKGIVFQADGTIGGKRRRTQRAAWRARPIRALLRFMMFVMLAKVGSYHVAQIAGFDARAIDQTKNVSVAQPLLKVILYPDPVSVQASKYLTIGQELFADELRKVM